MIWMLVSLALVNLSGKRLMGCRRMGPLPVCWKDRLLRVVLPLLPLPHYGSCYLPAPLRTLPSLVSNDGPLTMSDSYPPCTSPCSCSPMCWTTSSSRPSASRRRLKQSRSPFWLGSLSSTSGGSREWLSVLMDLFTSTRVCCGERYVESFCASTVIVNGFLMRRIFADLEHLQ